MTRRIAAAVVASVIGGVILSATPSHAFEVCFDTPNREGGRVARYCLTDNDLSALLSF